MVDFELGCRRRSRPGEYHIAIVPHEGCTLYVSVMIARARLRRLTGVTLVSVGRIKLEIKMKAIKLWIDAQCGSSVYVPSSAPWQINEILGLRVRVV